MKHHTQWMVLAALATLALVGCSEGGRGMSGGPVAGPSVDSFTSAVATLARDTPEDTQPVDIEAIPVVLVENGAAVTVQ